MKNYFREISFLVLGGLLAFGIQWYFESSSNSIKYLDYGTHSINRLLDPVDRSSKDSIRMFIGTKRVKDFTVFHIYLANLSNQSFEDVPVYIELYDEKFETLEILDDSYFDQNNSKESISIIENVHPTIKNGKRYGYRINSFNRSPDFKKSVYFSYILQGNVQPKFKIHSDKANIEIREFTKQTPTVDWNKIRWFVIGFAFAAAIGLLFSSWKEKEAKKRMRWALRRQRSERLRGELKAAGLE